MATQEDEAAREHRNLIDFARTTEWDLYALLNLPDPHKALSAEPAPPPSDATLKKAWRDAALRNHPDKNRGDEEAAADRLDRSQRAYTVLRDEQARTAYDDRRRAEAAARAERDRMSTARRAMVERLEKAERQAASPGANVRREETDAERRARELRAFEADMARKKAEYLERRRQRREDEAAAAAAVARQRKSRDGVRAAADAAAPEPEGVRAPVTGAPLHTGPVGSPLASAPEWQDGVQSYYAYTMGRLREAQRRKEAGTLRTDGPLPTTGLSTPDMRTAEEVPRFKSFKPKGGQAASAGATHRRHEAERERLRREILERERGAAAVG